MTITEFDYISTRNEMIGDAFEIVGAKEAGQNLTANELAQGLRILQRMIKAWANENLCLWNLVLTSFTTVAAQEIYTTTDLSGDDDAIIGLDNAWVVVSSNDWPLEVISYSKYLNIEDKEVATGRPTHIAFRPAPEPSFCVYPSPDTAYTIKIYAIYPLKDFDSASGSGNLPARFQDAIVYGLADRLFDRYPGPMNERQWIKGKAEEFFMKAKNMEYETETTQEVEGFFPNRRW
jgi:hypothetical protein